MAPVEWGLNDSLNTGSTGSALRPSGKIIAGHIGAGGMKAVLSAAKLQLAGQRNPQPRPSAVLGVTSRRNSSVPPNGLCARQSKSLTSLEVQEVRALADDAPSKDGDLQLRGPHEQLMQRLKSRAARKEAESTKNFLASYRKETVPSTASEARLDDLLKNTSRRAEELKIRSEEMQQEVADAERKLEKVNTMSAGRASETELQTLNPFERSQRRIAEDKREEDLQKQRDEVQANYAKVHRRMQNELIELRDYKVLLREYRRVRLEKLHETLQHTMDGRRLRACVREMIRHGAQRILQKMEGANLPLEPWAHEVLVNCCHVEIRIEEAEEKLLSIRRQALKPVKQDVEAMLSRTKQERFELLCQRAWEGRHSASNGILAERCGNEGVLSEVAAISTALRAARDDATKDVSFQRAAVSLDATDQSSEDILSAMRKAEANIQSLRRLLNDMRHNAAAVICNQIRQAEKSGGKEVGKAAAERGSQMLATLVSEDFAKATMKELQKSAPTAKLTA
mmetsp:Transcript_84446/g.176744  ORF Transcript_84446/g.176744 Transcript_84446/m.176744 type:complete len:510 (+) Transcript_84446:64-1593(+)|eukprot:CAMPEP_0206499178 /NCGR_PEP_ID=MMETSP0324_2-20121206/51535_1 /ASSEMBLY_ACC=CAM_ASM_000836 /TAXON_ID=2866 /ORGANISM="Crypthecodinium cohnii, Strain Seligo" /LENGTH=509 /DNA_ID=CAMNT_0053985707 /DNA_START=52 /DNA_END=1581 /DNA_ORIENTATION=-